MFGTLIPLVYLTTCLVHYRSVDEIGLRVAVVIVVAVVVAVVVVLFLNVIVPLEKAVMKLQTMMMLWNLIMNER